VVEADLLELLLAVVAVVVADPEVEEAELAELADDADEAEEPVEVTVMVAEAEPEVVAVPVMLAPEDTPVNPRVPLGLPE
jgi:hypothetical protein